MKPKAIALVSSLIVATFFLILVHPFAQAQDTTQTDKTEVVLRAYGPGGPAPAMREAAMVFGEKKGIKVEVVAGPTLVWKEQAMKDADLIFSGSEYMMTDFAQKDLPGLIDASTIRSMYLRPSAILVRPGNPKGIKGINDLAKPGFRILVVQGAGQVGMWEDVAGRTGNIKLVDGVRRNIGAFAPNSAEAKKIWGADPAYDAWLIWTIWQKESPASADLVNTEPENTIYRSCGVAITNRSEKKVLDKEFADFLQSAEGQAIFVKWGWLAP
ncbi:MAG: substrate-binding domain-containing protein [Deltaproteobacteria bacterium]|nr:substrate-binding domain-containing protein [Deltaproteobacteria bacterium]